MNRRQLLEGAHCTLNSEVCRSDGVVARSGRGGPAEVDAAVLGADISDDQVPVAQHPGIVHVDGLAVRTAPGDDGPWVARGHALQHHRLVEGDGDVLRSRNDSGPLTRCGACDFSRKLQV